MNEENNPDHDVEGDVVEGLVVCISRKVVLQALNEMKTGKAPGPSEASLVSSYLQGSRNSRDG